MGKNIYNSNVFGNEYAGAYDLIYKDKNYKAECDFLEKVFRNYSGNIKSVLDLGCGTGKHAAILAKRGYKLMGVDRSQRMIVEAKKRARAENLPIHFIKGDISSFKTKKKFDAVVSMFAVMGYFIFPQEVLSAFSTARKHLRKGGIFIFDVWNGVAVLKDKPKYRRKRIKKGEISIIRTTNPKTDILNQSVKINFDLLVKNNGKIIARTKEIHVMRFFFPQELIFLLQMAGFHKIDIYPFLSLKNRNKINDKMWCITVVAR